MAYAKNLGQRTQLWQGVWARDGPECQRRRLWPVTGVLQARELGQSGRREARTPLMNLEGQPETQRWCLVRKASHLREVEAESRKSLGEHNWPVSHGAFSEHHKQLTVESRGKVLGRVHTGLGGQACDMAPPPLSGCLPGPARPISSPDPIRLGNWEPRHCQ